MFEVILFIIRFISILVFLMIWTIGTFYILTSAIQNSKKPFSGCGSQALGIFIWGLSLPISIFIHTTSFGFAIGGMGILLGIFIKFISQSNISSSYQFPNAPYKIDN